MANTIRDRDRQIDIDRECVKSRSQRERAAKSMAASDWRNIKEK